MSRPRWRWRRRGGARTPRPPADDRALRRGRWQLTAQLAAAITAVVVIVGALSYVVTLHGQRNEVTASLEYTIGQQRTGNIDPCTWMFVARDGRIAGAGGAPAGLPRRGEISTVAAAGGSTTTRVRAGGTEYAVLTRRYGDEVRQSVFDERYLLADRRRLMTALLLAELIGLLTAMGAGALLARLAIAPLAEALTKQRRFVADASHELRTPLTRLHTRAQMLLARPATEVPAEVRTELRRLVDGGRELNEIVEDLLASADLAASRPAGGPVDVADLVSAVADDEVPRAGQAGVTITVCRRSPPGPVIGVAPALRRMVSALVDNAVRHSHPGGEVRLTVTGADRGRMVELVVADDGDGLDPAVRRRMFERFARGGDDGATDRHGLGLALVREVVRAHGGTVGASGTPGQGARFTVRLPAAGRTGRAPRGAAADRRI